MLALTNAKTIKTEVEGYADAKIAEKLSNKYGKGNLNLDTGEFIPVE